MAFLRMAMAGDYETDIVKEGAYDLICTAAELKDPKPGKERQMIQLTLRVTGVPNEEKIAPIYENLVLPLESDDPSSPAFLMSMQRIKRAVAAFKVPATEDGFDYEDFVNRTARKITVKQEEIIRNERPTGEFRNTVSWPKLKGELDLKGSSEAD